MHDDAYIHVYDEMFSII